MTYGAVELVIENWSFCLIAPVAQWREQLPSKQLVGRSSRPRRATRFLIYDL
jgi:hypothetical protein